MNALKQRRIRAVADLIRNQDLSSQEELAGRLAALGYAVTQATVSRDLEHLGALKIRTNGKISYALPEQAGASGASPDRLARLLSEWVRSVEPAGNLLVLKTPPGSAHLVGVELDRANLPEVVGTICGDDTIFIACRTAKGTSALAARLAF